MARKRLSTLLTMMSLWATMDERDQSTFGDWAKMQSGKSSPARNGTAASGMKLATEPKVRIPKVSNTARELASQLQVGRADAQKALNESDGDIGTARQLLIARHSTGSKGEGGNDAADTN